MSNFALPMPVFKPTNCEKLHVCIFVARIISAIIIITRTDK